MKPLDINTLNWKKSNSLIPVIIQHAESNQVLMLGYMNCDALAQTLESKRVTFYSRTKQRLWVKGESSGHFLEVIDIYPDCDQDALLILAKPQGPTCHLGSDSCFDTAPNTLYQLEKTLQDRIKQRPENSYTSSLLNDGLSRIAQKVGEEGVEVVIAAMENNAQDLHQESADLLYHLLLLLQFQGSSLQNVLNVLKKRMR